MPLALINYCPWLIKVMKLTLSALVKLDETHCLNQFILTGILCNSLAIMLADFVLLYLSLFQPSIPRLDNLITHKRGLNITVSRECFNKLTPSWLNINNSSKVVSKGKGHNPHSSRQELWSVMKNTVPIGRLEELLFIVIIFIRCRRKEV